MVFEFRTILLGDVFVPMCECVGMFEIWKLIFLMAYCACINLWGYNGIFSRRTLRMETLNGEDWDFFLRYFFTFRYTIESLSFCFFAKLAKNTLECAIFILYPLFIHED